MHDPLHDPIAPGAFDRIVGELACRDVLAALSAYVDGELDAEQAAPVRTHVAGGEQYDRSGGAWSGPMRDNYQAVTKT